MTTTIYRWSHSPAPSYEHRADLPTPMVMREISEYRSPIDGKLITSRGERNEDCKRNDAIPWEPGIGSRAGASQRTPGRYKNPRFADQDNSQSWTRTAGNGMWVWGFQLEAGAAVTTYAPVT